MKELDEGVYLLVIAEGPVAADAQLGHDLGPHSGHELAATVRGEAERDPKPGDSGADEGVGDGVLVDVNQWCSLLPACEAVDAGKGITVAVQVRQMADDVAVNVLEPGECRCKCSDWKACVSRDFGGVQCLTPLMMPEQMKQDGITCCDALLTG